MPNHNKKEPTKKSNLHPRNKHQGQYNFEQLIAGCATLTPFVAKNRYGTDSINFFDAEAVKMLNKALLIQYYNIAHWDIPQGYLCPPIPGRADYIHHVADLLAESNQGKIPKGHPIKCLDIGVGANCIYPIIGHCEYGWTFVGSDIDKLAVESANNIIEANPNLSKDNICRLQENPANIFSGIIQDNEQFAISICNPPFHASQAQAQEGTKRKLSNLKKKPITKVELNFGGKEGELWTAGGEKRFITDMIHQSKAYAKQCCWFTTLVSKKENLNHIYKALDNIGVVTDQTIPMGQGNKTSRIVAWTFLKEKEREDWLAEKNAQ